MNHKLYKFIFFLCIILFVFSPLFYRVHTSNKIEIDQTYPESNIVLGSYRIVTGQPLYQDFSNQPFVIMPYPPLYYQLVAKTFPAKSDEKKIHPLQVRAWGRYLSFIFFLLCCLSLFLISGQKSLFEEFNLENYYNQKSTVLLGPTCATILFATIPVFLRWSNTCRPDVMVLLFTIAGIFSIYRFKKIGLILAMLCFWIAFYTKHNFVTAPAAVFFWLLIQRKWIASASWAAVYAIGILILLITGNQLHNSQMLPNMLAVIDVPMRFEAFRYVFPRFIRDFIMILLIGGGALFLFRKTAFKSLIGIYLTLSFLSAIFSIFKLGSSVNYFLEPAFALCILSALLITKLSSVNINRHNLTIHATILTLAILLSIGNFVRIKRWEYFENQSIFINNRQVLYLIRQLNIKSPGPILTDLGHLAIQFPEKLILMDPYLFNKAAYTGNWDQQQLINLIDKKRIGVIAFSFDTSKKPPEFQGFPHFSEQVLEAVNQNYQPVWQKLRQGTEKPELVLYLKK